VVPDARAPVDSALLFALAAGAWRMGESLGDGLAHAVRTVTPLAAGRYNLLAGDGTRLAATTWGDTLFIQRLDGGIVLASEPYDDEPGWEEVPDRSLVTAGPGGVGISPLRP
jgi:glutamine amidotransferase